MDRTDLIYELEAAREDGRDAFLEHLGNGARKRGLNTAEGHAAYLEDPRVIRLHELLREAGLMDNPKRRAGGLGFAPFSDPTADADG
jgi:hypothetical protein